MKFNKKLLLSLSFVFIIYFSSYKLVTFTYDNIIVENSSIKYRIANILYPIIDNYHLYKLFYLNPKLFNNYKPNLIISLSKNDIKTNDSVINSLVMSNQEILLDQNKNWRNAKALFQNKEIKIKYKFHGSALASYYKGLNSYSIKSQKSIYGAKEFKLVNAEEMNFFNIFLNKLSNDLGLISEDTGEILSVNDSKTINAYFFYKTFNPKYIHDNYGLKNPEIFRGITKWESYSDWHSSELDGTYYNLDSENVTTSYLEKWKNLNSSSIDKTYIDENYFGKFFSLIYLFGSTHQIIGDNDKWVISEKKILPVYRNEGSIRKITTNELRDNKIFEVSHYQSNTLDKYLNIISMNGVLNSRNIYLNQLLKNKKEILKSFDSIYEYNKTKHKIYNNHLKIKSFYLHIRRTLISNFEVINKYLNSGYTVILYDNNKLSLKSSRNNQLKILVDNQSFTFNPKKVFNKSSKIISTKLNELEVDNINNINNLLIIDQITKDTLVYEKDYKIISTFN